MPGKKTKTTPQFIKESREKHGDKYDYSSVEYLHGKLKVIIICTFHGTFNQTPKDHLSGQGCPRCSRNYPKTQSIFIEQAKACHGDLYDYSKTVYHRHDEIVLIYCKVCCEDFGQRPGIHLSGSGCKTCGNHKHGLAQRSTTEEFVEKATVVHGKKYSYDLVIYVRNRDDVIIHCLSCDIDFRQSPSKHLSGLGCSRCAGLRRFKKTSVFVEEATKFTKNYTAIKELNTPALT